MSAILIQLSRFRSLTGNRDRMSASVQGNAGDAETGYMALSQRNALIIVVALAVLAGTFVLISGSSGTTRAPRPPTHADNHRAKQCEERGGMWHPIGGKDGDGFCMK